MADVKKIATRDSYGSALAELGASHPDLIVFDADLAGATKTAVFKKAFPDRHFNWWHRRGGYDVWLRRQPPQGTVPFASASPCLPPAAPLSRFATPSATPT